MAVLELGTELFTAAGLQHRVSLGLNSLETKIGTALGFTVASTSCEADNAWSLLFKKQHWGPEDGAQRVWS